MPTTNSGPNVTDLNPTLHGNLDQLVAAVRAAGGNPTITSGYRSFEKQKALYDSGNGGVPVAKPGTSLHEKGLAADVSGDEKTMQLLHSMAGKYGLTFPMANDPVHVQLLSTPAQGSTPMATATTGGTTQPSGPMELSARFDVLAKMLNPNGSSTASGMDPSTQSSAAGTQALIAGTEADTSTAIDPSLGGVTQAQTQTPAPAATAGVATTADGTGAIGKFMNALSGQESGGNYNSKNKDSGASGKYQIMPANWPAWSREAGLPAGAAMTPENQEMVARHKIQQYFDQFGNWRDVATAWYAGPGAVGKANGNAGQGAYPTINKYADTVMARMNG